MTSIHATTAAAIYDARSEQYDQSFHPKQAADFVSWAELQPGEHVLDLACGTGLISLLAKEKVGPQGTVTGVDISSGMLAVARRKADEGGIDVSFAKADICDLMALTELPAFAQSKRFDVITCASALVLLEDIPRALESWATLLKHGGRIIVDVPTEESFPEGAVFGAVGKRLGIQLPFDRSWVESQDSLPVALQRAGFEVMKTWRCPSYEKPRYINVKRADEIFEKLTSTPMLARFKNEDIRERSKALFKEELVHWAGPVQEIRAEDCFYVAVGKKL